MPLPLDQAFGVAGELREEPRQQHLDADVIVRNRDRSAGRLAEEARAEFARRSRPGLLDLSELRAERRLHAAKPRLDASHRFIAAEPVRNGDDERLRHGTLRTQMLGASCKRSPRLLQAAPATAVLGRTPADLNPGRRGKSPKSSASR